MPVEAAYKREADKLYGAARAARPDGEKDEAAEQPREEPTQD